MATVAHDRRLLLGLLALQNGLINPSQSFRMHRGHHKSNQSRSRIVSAPLRCHEPHEHASESAGTASSVNIDARVTAIVYT
jgi:hypothetical protein